MTSVPPIAADLWDQIPAPAQAALLAVVRSYEPEKGTVIFLI
jgi:hypothetical protein